MANLTAVFTDSNDKIKYLFLTAGQEYWVAGSDWGVDGQWVWEPSGMPVTTDHWFLSDPNGGSGEECMSLKRVLGFQWTDDNCTLKKNYVCEKSEGYV
ncbi:hypothetical protein FSP39_005621 [Pinctada imbricata]|uniref:C-type lectin domain-containing protein n=1 Tax=Pinctada imbricata TaxID=66713 RepID=A0AA88Y2I3_PINIB|nr:hypothetical protein FSP39_005621 [Pinctada imbricata]